MIALNLIFFFGIMAQEESMYTRCSLILASCSRNNHALAVRDCFLNRALQAVHSHFYNWTLFLLVKLLVLERPVKNLSIPLDFFFRGEVFTGFSRSHLESFAARCKANLATTTRKSLAVEYQEEDEGGEGEEEKKTKNRKKTKMKKTKSHLKLRIH